MSAEDLAWVTETLVEAERRRCVSRVSSVETEDAVAKGNNYASQMHRLKLSVVLHSGEVQKRSLIYKVLPASRNQRSMLKEYGTFSREGRMYTEVLSEMESIRIEKEIGGACLWPEFYGTKRRYEGLLFEDLCTKGYKMANRHIGMDYEHSSLAMRALAKFHALAAILKERGDLHTKDYPFYLKSDPNSVDDYYQVAFNDLATIIENKWGAEWSDYVEKLKGLGEIIKKELSEIPVDSDLEFYTLNHGDFWVNNIMFRYNREGKPAAVRIIDFQTCNFFTPAVDLHYFLQTSPDLETRKKKMELLKEYHESLEESLDFFGYSGKIPGFQDILDSMKKIGACGVGFGLIAQPLVMAPRGTAMDMEAFFGGESEKGFKSFYAVYSEDETSIRTLQYILKEGRENGYL